MKLLAGIDVGTTGIKISFYTPMGKLVDKSYREYSLSLSRNGWVEINPEIWWEQLCSCLREVFARGKVTPNDVAGIGITCTNSLVLLNSDKKTLMPAIMQLDQRATRQAENLEKSLGQDYIFRKTGNRISSGAFWGPTLHWISENYPSIQEKVRFYLAPTSFIILRLTDVYCIDHSRASTTMLYNIHQKDWDDDLCRLFSLRKENLPSIAKSYEVVGNVNVDGAKATGLLEGTPVIAGGMDTLGAIVGLSPEPNNGSLIMGTVGRICVDSDLLDMRFMNTVNADASNYITITPVNNVGVSYKWLKQILFEEHELTRDIYKIMDNLAGKVKPGSDGLLFMPYLTGERSPLWDPHIRGNFINLGLEHQREHFIRAVLEGVGFALADNFNILNNELNITPSLFYAAGGGARSSIWMKIISSMLGKSIFIPEELETETRGAAILTSVGLKIFPDLVAAQKNWRQKFEEIESDWEIHTFYQSLLPVFKEFYLANRDLIQKWKHLQDWK